MEARAVLKYARISSRKVKIVLDLIRNKPVGVAMGILKNTPKPASAYLEKLLASAIANAVNNNGADAATLFVKEARVDAGPVMKRHFFDSRSHIGHRNHRTSHINIVVATRN